jgi:prepilin-type N-terminal cleavage/methylation domain-containing protein
MRRSRIRRGFSLLEVIVALGVLAVGATAAFSLLVAAAAAGRRAEHNVNAALIAETILNDVQGELNESFRLDDHPLASGAEPLPNSRPDPDRPPPADETRYLARNAGWSDYPGYTYDIAITPIPGPVPDDPWQFLVQVEVRWANRGKRRSAVFSTVLLKTMSYMDNPAPTGRR